MTFHCFPEGKPPRPRFQVEAPPRAPAAGAAAVSAREGAAAPRGGAEAAAPRGAQQGRRTAGEEFV